MSQHDMTVDNGAGLAVRADLNLALKALASQCSGASAPSPSYPCQLWADTGTGRIRQRDSANTLWIDLGPLDSATRYAGRLIGVQIFTASGTYTPTPGMVSCIIEDQGGGGGGAGITIPSAGNISLGAPGAPGAYAIGRFLAASIGASQVVTVGAAGTASAGAAGGTGGTSSVGSLISAAGGAGGGLLNNQVSPIINGNGVATAAPTGGNIYGTRGVTNGISSSTSASFGVGGFGGASKFGNGGNGGVLNGNGGNALNYGTGGGGTCGASGSATLSGGSGLGGIVIIWEYA